MNINPATTLPHPAPDGVVIYHWCGGLLLLAKTLVLARPTRPITATLRIALKQPYLIEVNGRTLTTRASLVAPHCYRSRVIAVGSDLALFYLPLESQTYTVLRQRLRYEPVIDLRLKDLAPVLPRLHEIFHADPSTIPKSAVRELTRDILESVTRSVQNHISRIDFRVAKACEIILHTPLNQFNLEDVAQQVHLSPSGLRNLFRSKIGSPIYQYARQSALWQWIEYWRPERTFTDVSLDAGFFDLAHSDKAFIRAFGMTPSLATDPRFVRLIDCD